MSSAFSVYIPRIFSNIPNKKIVGTFEKLNLGKVRNMNIIWKTGRDGSTYKMAFIHFSEWNIHNSAAVNFREKVENPDVEAKLVYDDPWYWIVLPNDSTENKNIGNDLTETNNNNTQQSILNQNYLSNITNNTSNWITERLTLLEEELSCVYEELYNREYIPVRYRTECNWDCDIETGNSTLDMCEPSNGNISPMTIDELSCHETPQSGDSRIEIYGNTPYDRLHQSPTHIAVNQYDDIEYYTNDINEHTISSYPNYTSFNALGNRKVADNTVSRNEIAISINDINDKYWMTMNYCGND